MKIRVKNNGAIVRLELVDTDALDVALRLTCDEARRLQHAIDESLVTLETTAVEVSSMEIPS